MTEVTHYTSSDGRRHVIKEMAWTYLNNAINKLRRQGVDDSEKTLAALIAEAASRPVPAPGDAPTGAPAAVDPGPQHKLAPAGIGDNNPPADVDPFTDRLNEISKKLLDEITEHEMAAARLPREVKSDEDVQAITDWVTKQQLLYRRSEAMRVEVKEPFLERGRKVDGFFKVLKDNLAKRADGIKARPTAYLQAKAAREKAEAQARADAARAEERRRLQEAEDARRRAEQAAEDARERQRALEDAAARTAAEQQANEAEAQDAGDDYVTDADQAAVDEAEDSLREAHDAEAKAAAEAASHDQAARDAAARAEQADAGVTHGLEKTVSTTGAAQLKKVRKHRVKSQAELLRGLGPLGAYFTEAAVSDALARATRADPWPEIPGVEFWTDEETAIRANPRR